MVGEQEDAAKAGGDALEPALMKATQSVERELARIVKTGEDDLDRLGFAFAEPWTGAGAVVFKAGADAD